MDKKVDTLKFYHSRAFALPTIQTPVAFLSALTTSRPVEFRSVQLRNNFNFQLTGTLESEWYRGRHPSRHIIAPGHVSMNVASEPFYCRVEPTPKSVSLHVILPQDWMENIRSQHGELLDHHKNRELRPMLGVWSPELQIPARQIAEALQTELSPLRLRMEEQLVELALRLWKVELPTLTRVCRERLPNPILIRILDYMHAHSSEDISLELLASLAGLSPFHFCRAFRASVGVSPWQYLKDIRFSQSRVALLETDTPVTDISLRLGFNSPSHFSTAFRSAYGISPTEFRKRNR